MLNLHSSLITHSLRHIFAPSIWLRCRHKLAQHSFILTFTPSAKLDNQRVCVCVQQVCPIQQRKQMPEFCIFHFFSSSFSCMPYCCYYRCWCCFVRRLGQCYKNLRLRVGITEGFGKRFIPMNAHLHTEYGRTNEKKKK